MNEPEPKNVPAGKKGIVVTIYSQGICIGIFNRKSTTLQQEWISFADLQPGEEKTIYALAWEATDEYLASNSLYRG